MILAKAVRISAAILMSEEKARADGFEPLGYIRSFAYASLDPGSQRSREQVLKEIREALAEVPGVITGVEQPLAHLISILVRSGISVVTSWISGWGFPKGTPHWVRSDLRDVLTTRP